MRPKIKRSHKYQLLCQQANNCVLKKNRYISHVKCESFFWAYDNDDAKFRQQSNARRRLRVVQALYDTQIHWRTKSMRPISICGDSKADVWNLTILKEAAWSIG